MFQQISTGMGGHLAGDGADKGPVIPRTSAGVEAQLTGEPMSIGYEPQLPVRSFWIDGGMPPYWEFVRDIEAMRRHPHVRDCLNIYMGGIWPAKFKIKASSPEIAEFVGDQIRRYWSRSLRAVQDSAYSYGHCGGEVTFANERGRMVYKDMTVFHPADAKVLVKRNRFVGIRVRSSKPLGDGAPDDSMSADLWSGTPSRPGKAFWYCHNSRNSRWYGESQLLAAWRPWRRLSYPDGLDEVLDGGLYRYAYGGYVVKAPPGSEKALRQPAGAARQDYLDKAREMAESLKAGASIGMSSEAWEGNGQPKWSIEQLHAEINVSGLLEGKKNLTDEISFGIGVPPEIREASDTGSGYSGRAVPKEVFYLGQQHHAESQVKACRLHWLDGLIHWNYGKDAWFEIEVAPLLASQQQQVDGQGGAAKEEGAGEPQQGGESDDGGLGAIFGGEPDAGAQQLKTPEPIGTVVIAAPLTPAETTSYEEMILAEIVKAATRTAATLSRQARREIQAAIHGRPAILWADAVSVVLRRYGPKFGRILRDVRVAAAFVGARRGGNFITPPGSNSMSPPPDRPWGLPPMSDDHGPGVTLPVIEEAARDLEERRIFTRPHFDQLESAESARSFTVANLHDDSAVASARDLIVAAVTDGTTQRDFAKQLDTALDGGASHLSPAHVETVFRTNVMNAYSNGLEAVLDQPGVGDGFPYAQYDATHDDRSRPEHRAMEKSGIAGTNVYRRDDPVWMKFRPPWGYSCRCAWTPLTLKQAADLGIAEAQEWLRTGIEPAVPSWVPHPDFDLPPGWHRLALGEPEGAEEFQWLTGNAQLSFTGVKEDSIGRKMYYREGVHIAGPSDGEKAEIEAARSDDPPGDIKAKSGKKTTKTSKAKRPPKAAPGSQMDDATKAKLMEFGMKGSFPPADVPLSEIEFADLSRGADSLKFEALMWWTQKGTDSGRLSSQYRYTKAFHDRNAAEKHERVKAIEPYIGKIAGTLNAQMGDVSLPQRQREAAAIASVIRETGLRPTDSNESIKHGHFGISSLQARHLKLVGNKVHLDFIGKEGVHNKSIVRDPANVAFLKAAMGGKSGKAFVFEKATGNDAGVVLKAAAVGAGGSDDIKIKDLRTLKAHQLGRQAVANFKGPPPPLSGNKKNDAKAIAKAILAMSTEVSQVLNNQPTEARNTYIHPEIFKSWQANLANAR